MSRGIDDDICEIRSDEELINMDYFVGSQCSRVETLSEWRN